MIPIKPLGRPLLARLFPAFAHGPFEAGSQSVMPFTPEHVRNQHGLLDHIASRRCPELGTNALSMHCRCEGQARNLAILFCSYITGYP